MHSIPVTVLDDFLDNPELWVDLASKCEYNKAINNNWPGVRSSCISTINREAYDSLCKKFFSIFYNLNTENIQWNLKAFFQKVPSKYIQGWVHKDLNIISGIIYLDRDYDPEAGTSIYEPISLNTNAALNADKQRFFNNEIDMPNGAYNKMLSSYRESIKISNKFNRLVAFDANLPHKANKYSEDRLTIVFFIENLLTEATPIARCSRA